MSPGARAAERHHRPLWERRRLTPAALFPGLATLRGYRRVWLRGDVLAGITVAAYLVPQVMAYAQVAGLPPAVGLFGAIGPALAYLVFGGSRRLSVGPESTTALMTATALAAAIGPSHDPHRYAALAAALAVVVGLLCLVAWLVGLGFAAQLLSKPVLVGYMAGVAALMIVSQIQKTTGIPAAGETLPAQVVHAVQHAGHVHWPTLTLSASLVIVLLVMAKLWPKGPNALIGVLVATAASSLLHLERHGIKTVGTIPSSLPAPHLPALSPSAVMAMLAPALGIAVVAYTDNVLTARAFAHREDPPLDDNQEFLALGMANVAAGVTGGFPCSSSGSRTALGVLVGARTQLSSLVTALSIVGVVAFLGPVLARFPRAALGALVVYAATRLVEVAEIRRIGRFRRSELVLLVATTLGVFFLGVLGGIGLAVALSLADLLRRVARPHDGVLGYVPGLGGMHDVDDYPTARQVPGLVVYRYDSPLFFANAEDFRARALLAVDEAAAPVRWFVLNTEANVEADITSLDAVAQLRDDLASRGIVLALARVKRDLLDDFEAYGVDRLVDGDRVYPTLPEAVRAYLDWYRHEFGRLPAGIESVPEVSAPARWRDGPDEGGDPRSDTRAPGGA